MSDNPDIEVAVIGGGICGLWVLNRLYNAGFDCALFEADSLGCAQTLASQGMIHGGIKYTLSGGTTTASETIRDMPARWKDMLDGKGEIDLSSVKVLSDAYYLFSDSRLSSRITAFFGSKAIEGRVTPVSSNQLPDPFQSDAFKGVVYELQDVVIDTPSLLSVLTDNCKHRVFKSRVKLNGDGSIDSLELDNGESLTARYYILAAGAGNEALVEQASLPCPMQRRPLHQVMLTSRHLPRLYAHAVSLKSADKPRITITTHEQDAGLTWYLGGQIAESGVDRSEAEQIEFTQRELARIFPWMDFSDCDFSTLRVDRAEPLEKDQSRPDFPFVAQYNNAIVCWPTKLTLVPMLGDELMQLMTSDPINQNATQTKLDLELAAVGINPWTLRS